jgi:hypothetical protein
MAGVILNSGDKFSVVNSQYVIAVDHDRRAKRVMVYFASSGGELASKQVDGSPEQLDALIEAFTAAFDHDAGIE